MYYSWLVRNPLCMNLLWCSLAPVCVWLSNFLRLSLGTAAIYCMHKHFLITWPSVGGMDFSEEFRIVHRHDPISSCKILGSVLEADTVTWILPLWR